MVCNSAAFRAFLFAIFFCLNYNLGLAAPPARLIGEVRRTNERLNEVVELERAGQLSKAFELCCKLIDEVGDDFVSMANEDTMIPARRWIVMHLANNSELKKLYESRHGAKSDEMLQQGRSRRDASKLTEIVDDYWPAEAAGSAIDTLGELAFERGDFPTARHWWRQLRQRESTTDKALVNAKLILANHHCGEPITTELASFRQSHADAVGHLAGQTGKLADILEQVSKERNNTSIYHNVYGLPRGRWESVRSDVARPGRIVLQPPNVQPAIWRGHLIVNDGEKVTAIELGSGRPVHTFGDARIAGIADDNDIPPAAITLAGDVVIARLNNNDRENGSHIICLEQDPDHHGFRFRVRSQLTTAGLRGSGHPVFEGTPIADNGVFYVSWIRQTGLNAIVWIGAYSVNRPEDGPKWARPIIELQVPSNQRVAGRRQLVLAGSNIVYISDAGLIVALNAQTGRPVWAVRYNQRSFRGPQWEALPSRREIGEQIVASGQLFAAPADSDQLMAIDTWTGKLIWPRSPRLEVVHLLGVSQAKLIFTADGMLRGLGAIDVTSGNLVSSWGTLTGLSPYGRGLLTSSFILLPTQNAGLKIIRLNGQLEYPPTVFQSVPGGNLTMAEDHLVAMNGNAITVLRFEPRESSANQAARP